MADVSLTHVRARRQQVQRELEALKVELSELEIAERVLSRLSLADALAAPPTNKDAAQTVPLPTVLMDPTQRSKGTVEEMIRTYLLEHKTGWATATEIKEWVSWRTGRDVPMSTISPTLSNMKGKSIVRVGLKVAAMERASLGGGLVMKEDGNIALPDEADDGNDIVTTADEADGAAIRT